MAASGNGTFIPMVSSSPPPMDDVTFDDDVDDDEFSNFSHAPLGLDASPAKWDGPSKGSFEPIKANSTDPFQSADHSHPGSNDDDFGTFASFGSTGVNHNRQNSTIKLVSNNNFGGHPFNGNEGDEEDEFADFEAFQSTPVGISQRNDGFLESDRQSKESAQLSSVVLNKNNSHENVDSHNELFDNVREHGNDLDSNPAKLTSHKGFLDSTSDGGAPDSDLPSTESRSVHKEESGTFSNFQSMIPSQSSLDYEEPTHKLKDTAEDHNDSNESPKGDFTVTHLEKPSTGSLSLIQQSDRQTFDSGIDSIMTPSDSSPEGRDDGSVKVLSEDDANDVSLGVPPGSGKDGDDWGDFDTFPSADKPSDNYSVPSIPTDATYMSMADPDAETLSSSTHNNNEQREFGLLSRTQQECADTDTSKDMLSNPDNMPLSHSSNMTSSSSKPQNETKVQCNEDNDDDDNFGDFSNAHKLNTDNVISSKKGNDDFDDFGDFESTKRTTVPKTEGQRVDKSDSDWGNFGSDKEPAPDDDFGDFGAFGSNAGPATSVASIKDPKEDDFGTFSSNVGSSWGEASKESSKYDDDFGSFGSSSSVPVPQSASIVIPSGADSSSSQVPPGGRVERLFKSCFPESIGGAPTINHPVLVIQDIFRVKEPPGTKGKADKSSASNAVVWDSLSDMENTMAQKYHWNNSKNSGKLLRSLGIDSRNILPPGRGGRPLFAQELGMLTPSKPGEISDKAPLGGVSGGGLGDVSSGAEDSASTTSSVTEDTVPKVEFDWSNSGLINPLDANSLNLDFFANERKSSSSRHKSRTAVQKVDPELLDFAVSPSDPPLQPALTASSSKHSSSSSSSSSQRKSPNPLDEILKHSSSSMVKQKPKREAGLSSEANSVLDSLPDLSYMLAKVLMFPVASSSSSSSPSKLQKRDAVPGTGWAESIS